MAATKAATGTSTVLVYWMGDEIASYVIPDSEITPVHRKMIELSNNVIVNSDEPNDGTTFVSDAVCDKPEYCSDKTDEADRCIWAKRKHDFAEGPIRVPVSAVYMTGFLP